MTPSPTTNAKSVPEWAMERMRELTGVEGTDDEKWLVRNRIAFARYIAEHEEAPVDPLLIEAREIAASTVESAPSYWSRNTAEMYRSGDKDDDPGLQAVVTALRRGIELAGEQK